MSESSIDFPRSYLRFYLDFENRQPISISRPSPVRSNRVRVALEAMCSITHHATRTKTTYVLSAACKTENVGGTVGDLWIQPNADCIFIGSDDGEFAVYKSWSRNDMGVMLEPPTLGPQPERQTFRSEENFDDCQYELCEVAATVLNIYESVATAVRGDRPLVARIEYEDGDYEVCIEQPVKTINLAERDQLFQIDTGPIIVPDLRPERLEAESHFIGVFDLAYSAFHERDWAEVVLRKPTSVSGDVSVNHYSEARLIRPTRNSLLELS
ncbi:MAG: hypothetical protein H8E66_03690 [Planctomycetes bacterium]|nr:hypothetical protein [Planctomycetota bacterium]